MFFFACFKEICIWLDWLMFEDVLTKLRVCRSCSCAEGKSELAMQNMSRRRWSQPCIRNTGVYNSHGPKEFHIDSEVVERDNKLLIDCSQDSVVGMYNCICQHPPFDMQVNQF